jgi:outer membrane protein OmpA-like peptidoglycan-associated protein
MGKGGCCSLGQLGRRTAAGIFVCVLALPVAPAAFAQAAPDYTAGSIVEHFSKLREPHQQKAKTRSVFIGASGFSQSDEAAQDEKFNLLITFEYNSDRLTPAARRNLDEFARALVDPALADARFVVEGHTDATGPADYNLDLSRRRAASVVTYLVDHGIDPARLEAQGFGETKLRSDRPDDPVNRRVETRLAE